MRKDQHIPCCGQSDDERRLLTFPANGDCAWGLPPVQDGLTEQGIRDSISAARGAWLTAFESGKGASSAIKSRMGLDALGFPVLTIVRQFTSESDSEREAAKWLVSHGVKRQERSVSTADALAAVSKVRTWNMVEGAFDRSSELEWVSAQAEDIMRIAVGACGSGIVGVRDLIEQSIEAGLPIWDNPYALAPEDDESLLAEIAAWETSR